VASSSPLAKPIFDGTFGANCPPCKEFGQTVLKKLYAADGIADAVDFQMHSAIRSAGSPSKDHSWACPDEDPGCPMTKWFICAVDGWNTSSTTQDQRVNFLTCWDDAQGSSEDKAKACSKQVGFDFSAVSACNSGPKGEALQLAAAEAFEKRFPTHAHNGMFEVPHIFINGQDIGTNRDFNTVLKKLCASGIKAGACKDIESAAKPDPTMCLKKMEALCPDTKCEKCCVECLHKHTEALYPLCHGTGSGEKHCGSRDASELSPEDKFMRKWGHMVKMVTVGDLMRSKQSTGVNPMAAIPDGSNRKLLQFNPFAMLNQIISGITGAWSSIVNAFKSSYSEQLDYEQLARGWSKFKESTKVFKGEGLTYEKAPEFFADIRQMIQIPANYSKDFDQMIKFIQFFDREYWSQHDTVFSIGKEGTSSHFTMMANNNQNTSKIDLVFLTLAEQFKLAPDIFVITESHSYLGGLWSTSHIKFKKKPAAITDEELSFVSQYFLLLAYQEIALAEGLPAPPNPNFGPPPPPAPLPVSKAAKVVFPLTQNCAVPGHCGRAYQACCFAYGKKGYPCGCHLQDGSPGGAAGSSCGTCGVAYATCCTAYKAKGYPCTCDVEPASP
jgi:glutaredoxin